MNKGQCVLTYLKKCDNVTKPKSSTLWECSVTFNDIPIIFCACLHLFTLYRKQNPLSNNSSM